MTGRFASPRKKIRKAARASRDKRPKLRTEAPTWPRVAAWVLAGVTMLTVLVARIRLLNLPLERDEGEYAYIGQLMLKGFPPYQAASNMKLPGTSAAYALIMAILGQTPFGIHLGYLLVNAITVWLVYKLTKRLFDQYAALASASAYAILSFGLPVLGNAAHATHFVVLPALAATLLLDCWDQSRRNLFLFLSGLLYGAAFLAKQPGLAFAAFGGLCLLLRLRQGWNNPRAVAALAIFISGVLLPYALLVTLLWKLGVFANFWFWTVTYGAQYASMVSWPVAWQLFKATLSPILGANPGIWLLAAAGLIFLWWKPELRSRAILLTVLLLISFLAVCPGLYFRRHYFVLLLPAISLLTGAAVWGLYRRSALLASCLLATGFLWSVVLQKDYLFDFNPANAPHRIYGGNPFPEAIPIADYIASHTKPNSPIAVLGSEPEIYFYAKRPSATGYIYIYGLMEPHPYALRMQNEMIRDIEAARPEYIVFVNIAPSWLIRETSPRRLDEWWSQYQRNYQPDGIAEIINADQTVYRWGADAVGYTPKSNLFILLLKRISS